MQLSNHKLVERGVQMIVDEINVSRDLAKSLLKEHGSVRKAVDEFQKSI